MSRVTSCDRPDGRPDEGGLALRVGPRVEVVGDPHAGEAGLLGTDRAVGELAGIAFLAGQEVAEADHGAAVPER
jgi:hypothetical protein